MDKIKIEPTADEYQRIARYLILSQAHDTAQARDEDGRPRSSAALLVLRELIGLVAYLATLPDGDERIARLQAYAEAPAVSARRGVR